MIVGSVATPPEPDPSEIMITLAILIAGVILCASIYYAFEPNAPYYDIGFDLLP
jgi:hypothetical protein